MLPSPLQEPQSLTGAAFHAVEYTTDATQALRSKSRCRCRTHNTFRGGTTQAGRPGNRYLQAQASFHHDIVIYSHIHLLVASDYTVYFSLPWGAEI